MTQNSLTQKDFFQMVDKVWYDWQRRDPANFWAFEGGSVQNITSLVALNEYPNGMPPALHVSLIVITPNMKFPHLIGFLVGLGNACGWDVPRGYHRRRLQYHRWLLVLHLRMSLVPLHSQACNCATNFISIISPRDILGSYGRSGRSGFFVCYIFAYLDAGYSVALVRRIIEYLYCNLSA